MQLPIFREDIKVSEILILIEPPKDIVEYIALLKKEIYEEFGEFTSRTSKAHVTVNDFLIADTRIHPVLSAVKKRISDFKSFKLRLNGFSSFENSNTIYANVEPSDTFDNLIDEFEILRQEVIKTKKFSHSKNAHITIARKLETVAFKELRKRFNPIRFNHEFEVQKLVVLQFDRKQDKYEHFRDINLTN